MQTTVTFRTDPQLKADAADVFEALGMNLSTALNLFMRQAVRTGSFPCALDADIAKAARASYPAGFFALFGSDRSGALIEPEDPPFCIDEDIAL